MKQYTQEQIDFIQASFKNRLREERRGVKRLLVLLAVVATAFFIIGFFTSKLLK